MITITLTSIFTEKEFLNDLPGARMKERKNYSSQAMAICDIYGKYHYLKLYDDCLSDEKIIEKALKKL